MSIYKFLDNQERLIKKQFLSWSEAKSFAKENGLTCLTMSYEDFVASFESKLRNLEGHYNFSKLESMAKDALSANHGFGHAAIVANDFMRRVIEMPTPYIADWLEGKNNLEWLPDYVSESECADVVTYSHDPSPVSNNHSHHECSEINELRGLNTKISYLYRDADNYKVLNEFVVKGVISKSEQALILDSLNDGEFFIPSQVGLPEKRFDDGITDSDHCWFELDEFGFEETTESPNINIRADDLVKAFCARKGRWDDSVLLFEGQENQSNNQLSLQIASASERAGQSLISKESNCRDFNLER